MMAGMDDADIRAAIQTWQESADDDAADAIMALPPDKRRIALARLGYDTPAHQRMFGL
jgi:hypothetical protein